MTRVPSTLTTRADHRVSMQAVRYLIVGGCGYLLAIASYALLLLVGVPPYVAVSVVFVLNGVFNFVGVRLWAFPPSGRQTRSEVVRFCVVAAGSLVINYGSFAVLYSGLGLPAVVAQGLAIAIAAPFGFLANRLWSFRASGTPR